MQIKLKQVKNRKHLMHLAPFLVKIRYTVDVSSFPPLPFPRRGGGGNIPRDIGEDKTLNIKKVVFDNSVGPGAGFSFFCPWHLPCYSWADCE